MKNTAQIKLEITINSDNKTVKIIGITIVDGKEIIKYDKDIDDCTSNGIFFDELIQMLSKPIDIDKRFKDVMGI